MKNIIIACVITIPTVLFAQTIIKPSLKQDKFSKLFKESF